jgi:hypothetical protein
MNKKVKKFNVSCFDFDFQQENSLRNGGVKGYLNDVIREIIYAITHYLCVIDSRLLVNT